MLPSALPGETITRSSLNQHFCKYVTELALNNYTAITQLGVGESPHGLHNPNHLPARFHPNKEAEEGAQAGLCLAAFYLALSEISD